VKSKSYILRKIKDYAIEYFPKQQRVLIQGKGVNFMQNGATKPL
jgi:hypothetical protein